MSVALRIANEPTVAEPMLAVRDVARHFEGGRIKALDGVSFDIPAGQFVAIVGPSGSGKSTLLNILGALDRADRGHVRIDGVDLATHGDLAGFRRHTVGFVFQLHNLIPTLTAWENVQIPLMETRLPPRRRRERAQELLSLVGLDHRADNLPTQLSGGERQRVAIARALANEPRILIADEPTGAVDSKNAQAIMALLQRICRERGTTLVVVTHDPTVAALADRTIRFRDGQLVDEVTG